ncbi:MAG: hypothetical protein QXG01_04905 [Candidatus Bathyarchaeia archaeon]
MKKIISLEMLGKEFGDRLKTRIMLRLVVYCSKILVRWICE